MFGKLFGRNKPMDPEPFGEAIMVAMRQHETVDRVMWSTSDDFALTVFYKDQKEPGLTFLENAYRHHCTPGGRKHDRQLAIQDWATAFANLNDEGAIVVAELFPLVRQFGYLHQHAELVWDCFTDGTPLPANYDGPCVEFYTGDLVLILGQEKSHSVSFVSKTQLDEIGMSPEDAWEHAFANLGEDRAYDMAQVNDAGLMAVNFPDDGWLTPSILMFGDVFDGFMEDNQIDDLLVALPTRADILFTSAKFEHGMDMMIDAVRQSLTLDHPQSNLIFHLKKGEEVMHPIMEVTENGSTSLTETPKGLLP